eukprot:TRINITY_DN16450_c0_g2_i4.p1 TRINITY_DN16450_c0_g2~~TRINITY_DN16450_c0_g2_i4.p1  ORF type:complete len:614 (+),score=170.20 TRINITY_DN16450_c0_g2_i4:934-2775(+)
MNPAVPQVLTAVRRAHIGGGSIEIVGGMISSAIGVGKSLGLLTGDFVVGKLSFKWAASIQAIMFGFILLTFVVEAVVYRILKRYKSVKQDRKTIALAKSQLDQEAIDQMHLWASSGVERQRGESAPSAKNLDLPSSKNYDSKAQTKMKERLVSIYQELIDTEQSYVAYLKAFVGMYLVPLKQLAMRKDTYAKLISSSTDLQPENFDEISTLCTQVQTFLTLHTGFFAHMSEVPPEERFTGILAVFRRYSDFFRMYGEYVAKYDDRIALLGKMKKNKKFQKFLLEVEQKFTSGQHAELNSLAQSVSQSQDALNMMDDVKDSDDEKTMGASVSSANLMAGGNQAKVEGEIEESKSKSKGVNLNFNQTIESYLIMPIQRIPRYLLLLREILRNTADDQEYINWNSVFEQVELVCQKINKGNESREQAMKMLKIQDKISGMDFALVAPHRKFLKEVKALRIGAATRSVDRNKVRLYLFNDMLIWTNRSYHFKGHLDLAGSRILSILPGDILAPERADDVGLFVGNSVKSQRGFHVLAKKSLIPLTLIFDSPAVKIDWEVILTSAIDYENHTIGALIGSADKELPPIDEEEKHLPTETTALAVDMNTTATYDAPETTS